MPHIHTEEGQHDHTVSFFIIRTDFDEPKLILHKHKRIGKLMMFGGHVELNETPWQAALHEVTEETGYAHNQLTILQPEHRVRSLHQAVVHPVPVCSSTGAYPGDILHYHSDSAYVFLANEEAEGAPDEDESLETRLVTLAELKEIPEGEIVEAWRELGIEIFSYFLQAWKPEPFSNFS